MKEWHPDHLSFHVNENDQHLLYAWVVPANVGGIWTCEQIGTDKKLFRMRIDQTFQLIYGTIIENEHEFKLTTADLTAAEISFTLQQIVDNKTYNWNISGRVTGHFMEGQCNPIDQPEAKKYAWKAWREPSSARPLDALKIEF